jgi:hypothetical protein
MAKKKQRIKQTHPCGTPVIVDGFGRVEAGAVIEVGEEQAAALLAGKHFSPAAAEKKKS